MIFNLVPVFDRQVIIYINHKKSDIDYACKNANEVSHDYDIGYLV